MRTAKHDSRVDHAIANAAAGSHLAVDKVAQASKRANHSIREKAQQAKAAEEKWLQEADRYAHRHPLWVIGAAVVVGGVLGMLLHRRYYK